MKRSVGRITSAIYLLVALGVSYLNFGSRFAIERLSIADAPLFVLLGLHFVWGMLLWASSSEFPHASRRRLRRLLFVPEILASASLLFFLFALIFALNANMDYVQRFIESGGNLRLAIDTSTERLRVWIRLFPLVAVNLGTWVAFRAFRYRLVVGTLNTRNVEQDSIIRPWALVLTLLSAFFASIAMPSFLSLRGFPILGWLAFVPLFLVLRSARFGHGVFYGITFGVFTTLLSSYWLGTFSLVSLQITVLFFVLYYAIFSPIALALYRSAKFARVLVFPLAFTLFELLRSSGFLGYPWALAGHSQYEFLELIQIAELTGVWGVSFLVLLGNSALAEAIGSLLGAVSRRRARAAGSGWRLHPEPSVSARSGLLGLAVVAGVIGVTILAGALYIGLSTEARDQRAEEFDGRVVRISQVQQNNDPRKSEYENTFQTLQRLTNESMEQNPDIVVWSETAFVPNIRRWSEDTSSRRYNRLVNRLLDYQEGLETWLVTGNDDYEVIRDEGGREIERLNYNAAVMFSDAGERRETYHKIRLVPFTEYFPYREQFPWLYELLLDFDVHFWEPGAEPIIFEHPMFSFSTPICYEDVFPNYVRSLVRGGAEVILNLSNDYWSLAEVQAKQHFVAGLFRAVENRRPMLRTTSSGLTGQIDVTGRILQTAPYFEEAYIVSDVHIPDALRTTVYNRFGDYFPLLAGVVLLVILVVSLVSQKEADARSTGIRGDEKAANKESAGSEASDSDSADARATAPSQPSDEAPPRSSDNEPSQTTGSESSAPSEPEPQSEEPEKPARRRRKRSRQKLNWREIWDD